MVFELESFFGGKQGVMVAPGLRAMSSKTGSSPTLTRSEPTFFVAPKATALSSLAVHLALGAGIVCLIIELAGGYVWVLAATSNTDSLGSASSYGPYSSLCAVSPVDRTRPRSRQGSFVTSRAGYDN